ncbi:MAG: adenylate/guanylate cyclase domain-containing protein [Planctomycetota bacterium]|jgi:class 3 adenylate cyclase
MDLQAFGTRLKGQRERTALRQLDIANALRVSAQAVSKWERGENAPDIAVLPALCRLLGVSIEWLLEGSEPQRDTFPAVVFCSSVNGFAKRSATLPPREAAAQANSVHYALAESVLRFEGVPVKCVGDGFLAFFSGTEMADRAASAARQALDVLANPDLRIALHGGDIYLGSIGHPDYAQSDIMGSTVNTAFLVLQWVAENCDSGLGITGSVHEALTESASFSLAESIEVMGEKAKIEIFK